MSDNMGPPQTLVSGAIYVSPTDGFLIGNVEADPEGAFTSAITWIWGVTDSGMMASAAGGMMGNLNQTQSFMMPIAANDPFSANTVTGQGGDNQPIVNFYYVSLGAGPAVITNASTAIQASTLAKTSRLRAQAASDARLVGAS